MQDTTGQKSHTTTNPAPTPDRVAEWVREREETVILDLLRFAASEWVRLHPDDRRDGPGGPHSFPYNPGVGWLTECERAWLFADADSRRQ